MTKPKPRLTMDGLKVAMEPPNLCRVRAFLDSLDEESRQVLDTALSMDKREFPASAVRKFLLDAGFSEDEVPGDQPIQDHRSRRRPCRCSG